MLVGVLNTSYTINSKLFTTKSIQKKIVKTFLFQIEYYKSLPFHKNLPHFRFGLSLEQKILFRFDDEIVGKLAPTKMISVKIKSINL